MNTLNAYLDFVNQYNLPPYTLKSKGNNYASISGCMGSRHTATYKHEIQFQQEVEKIDTVTVKFNLYTFPEKKQISAAVLANDLNSYPTVYTCFANKMDRTISMSYQFLIYSNKFDPRDIFEIVASGIDALHTFRFVELIQNSLE